MQSGIKKSTLIVTFVCSIVAAYIGNRFGSIVSSVENVFVGISMACDILLPSLTKFYISFSPAACLSSFIFFLVVWYMWALLFAQAKNFRMGEEHGSARWGTVKEGKSFMDLKNPDNNLLLTERYGLEVEKKKYDLKRDRNLNVLVIGGSGSGKTRYVVKPNLMQLNANYFFTDPKGTAIGETGHLFEHAGYEIKSFNTIEFHKSLHYNPLQYVKTDADILMFVNCLIKNTNGEGKNSNDPFWEKSEQLLYTALIAFLRDWAPKEDYTIPGLLYLLSLAQAKEEDEDFQSPLDILFNQIEKGGLYLRKEGAAKKKGKKNQKVYDERMREYRIEEDDGCWEWCPCEFVHNQTGVKPAKVGGINPENDFALSNYRAFKTAAGKTLKSIIISCNVRLKPLEIAEVARLLGGAPDKNGMPTGRCELELDKLGDKDKKTIIYAILSDTDRTFSFLFAILMWQTVNVLCDKALKVYHGRLPRFVNFIFDEFAQIGVLPGFDQVVSVARSRNFAVMIILQSSSQLEARYDGNIADIIRDNCDTELFLGGKSSKTNKSIAAMIGKQTIGQFTYNKSQGSSSSYTKNFQIQGRDLMDETEVGKLPRDEAILILSGAAPLRDKKYPLHKHPRYKYIDPGHEGALYDKLFDYAEYINAKRQNTKRQNIAA